MHTFGARLSAWCVLIACLSPGVVAQDAAQDGPRQNAPPPPPAKVAGSKTAAAYLNTSFQAEESLARVRRQAQRQNWSAAAAAYQEIGEKFGRYLIRIAPHRYVSIRRYVNEQIADWPPSGLAAYLAAFGKVAETALDAARGRAEIETLVSIAERYYPTKAGGRALDEAAQLAVERGEFRSAEQWYAQLLATHPGRDAAQFDWRAKRAVCAAWQGDLAPLRTLGEELRSIDPGPSATWAGRQRPLADIVRDLLEHIDVGHPTSGRKPVQQDTRPTDSDAHVFCGSGARDAFFETTAAAEARLWRFSHFGPGGFADLDERDDLNIATKSAYLRSLASGRLLASNPVFGGGRLFCHDDRTVWAIDPLETDKPAWRFDLSPASSAEEQWISEDEPPNQFTTLWADDRVYAHLEHQRGENGADNAHKASALVCLDAATGRLIWQNNFESLASRFEDLRLDGAPLMHHGKLFVVVRRRKAFGFEACLLLCLDLRTGRLRWQTHIGEAPTGSYGYYRPTRTHPAAVGDLVIVHTNLGTVAAVSATTGRVVWLTAYDSRYADESEMAWSTRLGRPVRSWQYQPTMLWRDRIVCAPLDLEEILILQQTDGRLLRRLPLETLFGPEVILGLRGDLLYAVGSQVVCYDLAAERIAWQRPLAEGQILGRGAVTTAGLFIPASRALLHYPLGGGVAKVYPWKLEEAGNLLALPDQIVVASAASLFGLVSRASAFARLTERLARRPKDYRISLTLADLAFDGGENRRGLQAVRQAVNRLDGFEAIGDQQTRRKLFSRLLKLAGGLLGTDNPSARTGETSVPAPGDGDLDAAIELLEMAGRCATNPRGQVVYRLLLAVAQLRRGRPALAVETYQQILSDSRLRGLRLRIAPALLPPQLEGPVEAGKALAQSPVEARVAAWIGRLIDEHGRNVYASVERAARDRLKAAESAADPAAMLEVAAAFPNSRARLEALLAHARLAARGQHWRGAFRSYRRVLLDADSSRRPAVLREFIAALMDGGRADLADQWLQRAIRDHPSFRFEKDQRRIGFAELRRMLIGDRHFGRLAHATLTWPVRKQFARLYSDRASVLSPRFDRLPATDWQAILTYSNGRIEARSPVTGRSLWPHAVGCRTQPILLGMDAERYVLATAGRLFAVSRNSGEAAWEFGSEPSDDPNADPESHPAWTAHVMTARQLFAASDHGELVCLDLSDGSLRWRREILGGTVGHLAADTSHVFFAQWKGRHNVVHILDAATGAEVRTALQDETRTYQALVATPEGTLLAVLSRVIVAIRPEDGKVLWRIETPGHFVSATLCVNADGLFVSDDGQRMAKYDLYDGREAWRTPAIGTDDRDGLWAEPVGIRLLVASRDALAAFDTADGRRLWSVAHPPGLQLQSPIVVADAVVTVSVEKIKVGKKRAAPHRPDSPEAIPVGPRPNGPITAAAGQSYRVRRFGLSDGRELPVIAEGALVTEPLKSFGGLFARDRSLLLLDGQRLIGYVGGAE